MTSDIERIRNLETIVSALSRRVHRLEADPYPELESEVKTLRGRVANLESKVAREPQHARPVYDSIIEQVKQIHELGLAGKRVCLMSRDYYNGLRGEVWQLTRTHTPSRLHTDYGTVHLQIVHNDDVAAKPTVYIQPLETVSDLTGYDEIGK